MRRLNLFALTILMVAFAFSSCKCSKDNEMMLEDETEEAPAEGMVEEAPAPEAQVPEVPAPNPEAPNQEIPEAPEVPSENNP